MNVKDDIEYLAAELPTQPRIIDTSYEGIEEAEIIGPELLIAFDPIGGMWEVEFFSGYPDWNFVRRNESLEDALIEIKELIKQ